MSEHLLGWLAALVAARLMAELEPPARRLLSAAAALPRLRARAAARWLLLLPLGWVLVAGPAWSTARMLGVSSSWSVGAISGMAVWSAAWLVAVGRGAWAARQVRVRFWNP